MSEDILDRVVECVAASTRYPRQILIPSADLEIDLGIDSVKRVEIVLDLGKEFGVDLNVEDRDPSIRTLSDLSSWIGSLLSSDEPRVELREPTVSPPAVNQVDDYELPSSRVVPSPHFKQVREQTSPKDLDRRRPLAGLVALVTGSGHGIGSTIARVLAMRGATVVINSFHSREQGDQTAREINTQGGSAIHLWGSVANPEHVDVLFHEIEKQLGGIDILVCNASDGRIGPFL